jgi:para-nitrobenzyl esterase
MDFCTVETSSGKVRGLVGSGVRQFKGVPYGASTGGANRFQRPRPPAAWRGVRDCFGYAPVSPQVPSELGNDYARLIQFDLNVAFGGMSEDCLHLNVWTPDTGDHHQRAVLFSIHGGGFAIGSGNSPMYDGAKLASLGDVVVVTVTHRLASLAYLNLSDLGAGPWSGAGVTGILDLIAALQWVRDNIANFGGDPGSVMIFGQSGGGWKVSTLLGMPAARGLFHRAAVQSGSLLTHQSRESSVQVADAFIKKLGLSAHTLSDIQHLPWSQLLAAQAQVGAHAFAPVLDGINLVADAGEIAPSADGVPLIISTTLDDAGLFFDTFTMSENDLKVILTARWADRSADLLALYRTHFPTKSPYLLYSQMVTDSGFRRFAHAQMEQMVRKSGAQVYSYLWEWTSPAYEGKFGAVHAMDVSASFHNERDAILGAGSRDANHMCDVLTATWLAFAKTGDPNNPLIPHWPRFDATTRSTLILGRETRVIDDPHDALRRFWLRMPAPTSVFG